MVQQERKGLLGRLFGGNSVQPTPIETIVPTEPNAQIAYISTKLNEFLDGGATKCSGSNIAISAINGVQPDRSYPLVVTHQTTTLGAITTRHLTSVIQVHGTHRADCIANNTANHQPTS